MHFHDITEADLENWVWQALLTDDLCAGKVPGFITTITTRTHAAPSPGVAKATLPVALNDLPGHSTIASYLRGPRLMPDTTRLVADTGIMILNSSKVTETIANNPHDDVPRSISQSTGVKAVVIPAWCKGGTYTPWKVHGIPDYFSASVDNQDAIIVHGGTGHYTLVIDATPVNKPQIPELHLAVTVLIDGIVTTRLSWIHP